MADEATTSARGGRLPLIAGALIVIAVVAGLWVWLSAGKESTDDAQVDGHITQLATRVGGTIV